MILQHHRPQRPGTHAVECAVIYPVTFFFILSIIYGAMGVFRYQEMAALARDAARYGSVHGAQYRKDAALVVGAPGTPEGSANTPLDTSKAPYNAAPWNTILWYQCHPSDPTGTYPNMWADVIYDNSVRGRTILLDPAKLYMWIGWSPVINQTSNADNFPGSRIVASMKYQVFPEAFIWWNPSTTLVTVSTSAMPITN